MKINILGMVERSEDQAVAQLALAKANALQKILFDLMDVIDKGRNL
jgi:hypothetical protein